MKRTAIFLLCMVISVITFGQEQKRHLLPEVEVTPPRFTGNEEVLTKLQGDGFGYLKDYLMSNIQYPEHSLMWMEEGTEVVRFVVTPTGEVTDFDVINSVCPEIDKEVIRVLKTTSGMWMPASNNGKPVAIEKEISVAFSTDELDAAKRFVGIAKACFTSGNNKLFIKKNNKKALNFYNLAIRYVPNDKSLLLTRGICKYELGDKSGACKDWNRIKTLGGFEGDSYLDNFCEFKGYAEMMDTIK